MNEASVRFPSGIFLAAVHVKKQEGMDPECRYVLFYFILFFVLGFLSVCFFVSTSKV